jgi:two-component system, chemotaxis family, protein-glutamate methylesterase/glutaminase
MTVEDVARIVVCEDSPSYAHALRSFLELDADLRVVGSCGSGEELLHTLPELSPDLVTMDLELPGMGGVEATRRIMADHPLPILVVSGHAGRGSDRAAAALAAGALDAMPKSELRLADAEAPSAVALRRRVKRLARSRRPAARPTAPRSHLTTAISVKGRKVSAIGICSSTGGPQALEGLLGALPAAFPVPILVVQHISGGFLGGLIRWIGGQVAVPVREAVEGSRIESGVTFAAHDAHLTVKRDGSIGFDRTTVSGYHRPSGDVLLRSLASAFGERAAAVVLTGLGRDGAEGLAAVGAAGGLTFAQDEQSSAVYGMPRVAADRGAHIILSPPELGRTLAGLKGTR